MAAVVAQFILQGVSRVGAVVKSYAFRLTICKVSHHLQSHKSENFPDSKIFVAKTFRIKRVNRVNFQIRDKCALKVVLQDFG